MLVRRPAVANQFYDGDPVRLRSTVASLMPRAVTPEPAIAAISPHAGYIYSGHVAGAVFARVVVPRDVIILGPNHTGYGSYAAVMAHGLWEMPMGQVPIAEDLAGLILESSSVLDEDVEAHLYEHSLEVQVPFLQYRQPELQIVPICLGPLSLEACQEIGLAIERAVKVIGRPVLIVASTDMSHYVAAETAERLDSMAIQRILDLDPAGLYRTVRENNISMCGYIPTTIALYAAIGLGAREAELVKYSNSGEVSGDYSRVVGYAGLVVR